MYFKKLVVFNLHYVFKHSFKILPFTPKNNNKLTIIAGGGQIPNKIKRKLVVLTSQLVRALVPSSNLAVVSIFLAAAHGSMDSRYVREREKMRI